MLLTLTTTHRPATDLGYLLHKNPARTQSLELAFGKAHMFYPEATEARCTFALALDLDPIALVRGKGGNDGLLDQYVNDRPYAASSFLSVAMARGLRSALNAVSETRPELAQSAIPLEAVVTPLPVRAERGLVKTLFAPLGYAVKVEPIALDATSPSWGDSAYITLRLSATCRLADLLSHLYVLIPVLDLKKHYYIDADEVEKLLARGGAWLPTHPARDLIAARFLSRRRALVQSAIDRLAENDPPSDDPVAETLETPVDADGIAAPPRARGEEGLEKPLRLHDLRLDAVADVLKSHGCHRVVDLGCGSGKLLKRLLAERQFTEIVGVDVGTVDLEIAAKRLRLETMPERQRARIKLLQGALTYRDKRIAGYDGAALVEVIEHIDPDRLVSVERVVFQHARPNVVVVTTPNVEYNAKFETMVPGQLRHPDHRFEWTRAEFSAWCERVAAAFGYGVTLSPLGPEDAALGAPSQMAVFEKS
jgi:3' terminal RNA ribose 2'-O-methyltransferase Hen1